MVKQANPEMQDAERFPGSQPVSLARSNLGLLRRTDRYHVSWKVPWHHNSCQIISQLRQGCYQSANQRLRKSMNGCSKSNVDIMLQNAWRALSAYAINDELAFEVCTASCLFCELG